jgi:hypothetical protein
MFDLLEIVFVESHGDLFDQFWRSSKIDLGGTDISMSHIGGKPRQSHVNILPTLVPGEQSVNRKSVPQIVYARDGVSILRDVAQIQQLLKCLADRAVVQAPESGGQQ